MNLKVMPELLLKHKYVQVIALSGIMNTIK